MVDFSGSRRLPSLSRPDLTHYDAPPLLMVNTETLVEMVVPDCKQGGEEEKVQRGSFSSDYLRTFSQKVYKYSYT